MACEVLHHQHEEPEPERPLNQIVSRTDTFADLGRRRLWRRRAVVTEPGPSTNPDEPLAAGRSCRQWGLTQSVPNPELAPQISTQPARTADG